MATPTIFYMVEPFPNKLPYVWFISFWKPQNIITKIEQFFWILCWVHNVLFHYWMPVISILYILASCNFFNFETLLVKTFTEVLYFWLPLVTSTMYFIGINGCNPYTNWYNVYPIIILYIIMYENNSVWSCSSQSIILSLIKLVNRIPSTLLIDSNRQCHIIYIKNKLITQQIMFELM